MVSTHPGDHNNAKIKIGQTSQFSAIMNFMLKHLQFLAPFSRKRPLAREIKGKLFSFSRHGEHSPW